MSGAWTCGSPDGGRFVRLAVTALVFSVPLLLPLIFGALAQEQRALRGVALVIGQSDYQHLTPLPNPKNDADAIEKLLADLGFDSVRRVDRDAETLARDLERFAEDAENADVAVLYYSGHGIEAGGENYLVPVDADLSALDAAAKKLVPVSALITKLKATVPVMIVMLDACRDSPFPAGSMVRAQPDTEPAPIATAGLGETRGAAGLKPAEPQSAPADENLGTVIAFAAEPGKAALDGDAGSNSPYAAAVLRHFDAMAGEEFGVVMRMVAEEVYLKTAGKQRPWVNESLRRLLYFGEKPKGVEGEEGEILKERRQLLVTIAALPDPERRRVEAVATDGGVPMDALYAILRALGAKAPTDPSELDKVLRAEAERLAVILAERRAISSPDPEIMRLSALADHAEQEGALSTADALRQRAKARFRALRPTLEQQEKTLRQRFIEGAAVFARSAGTKALASDYLAAAQDYAEAFALVDGRDASLAWQYRNAEVQALTLHGGWGKDDSSLERAVIAGKQALLIAETLGDREKWATTQFALGAVFQQLARSEKGTARLEDAIAAYRAALQVRTRARSPREWAKTQAELGGTFWALGERKNDVEDLKEAVVAFRAAIQGSSRENNRPEWDSNQNFLGLVLWKLGSRENDQELLAEAVNAFRAILEGQTPEDTVMRWALTQVYLGGALLELGVLEGSPARIKESAAAFRTAMHDPALEVLTNKRAEAQYSLGTALLNLGSLEGALAPLQEAEVAFRAALRDYDRKREPVDWANAQRRLGLALRMQGKHEESIAPLEQAAAAFSAALEEYDREREPLEWADTQRSLGITYSELAERSAMHREIRAHEKAIAAWSNALQVYTRAENPSTWASLQNMIGYSLVLIGEQERDLIRLADAQTILREALDLQLQIQSPLVHYTEDSLCRALLNIGRMKHDRAILNEAKALCETAVAGSLTASDGATAQEASANLDRVRQALAAVE
ncbi:caspase family protein [Mesorhizobium sp. KR9-304]|uniref:caspase family protein n=1 Tax=Mesorhizobium sp. KR9-304 TaxID=3156614 RepID=UPI0032B3818B